ncbi:uracil-DNA glycosylase [Octopus vulgaris]|uniref:Uracil-DNA glycosylase n=1 Tax=Octopus vulgaris TaxID=6645 RepID=A0AA36BSF4_OCTVU|nr:uracil-DNA glycosylase [Octopus vulgaris]
MVSKISENGENCPPSPSLSEDQRAKIEQNRLEALAKRQKSISDGLLVDVGDSWLKLLEPETKKDYFQSLSKFVAAERNKHTIYPPANEVFSWTQLCPLKDIKVIIVGQDPYHGKNQAHGLCFSVKPGVKTPPSLVNIYKELETDIPGFQIPNHGTLTGWAKQGVLLLNSCLTVRASQANSHKDRGWEQLTDAVIRWLNDNSSALVFVLWGAYAQKKGAFINKQKHCILKSAHPSPFSANNGFFGCKHFSKCNAYLSKNKKKTIDWKKVL